MVAHFGEVASAHGHAPECDGQILDQSASLIVVNPVLKKMQAGGVATVAAATTGTVQFDHREQVTWGVVATLHFQHSSESDGDFEKRPTVKPVHVYRWRLDMVVDFQGVIHVAGSEKALCYGDDSFAER